MAIIINDQYRLRQQNFLDDRQGLASSISALKSWNYLEVPIPDGFEVFVGGVWYTYKDRNADDPTTGKFRSREDDQGITDHEARIRELEKDTTQLFFEDGCDTSPDFAHLLTTGFWTDSTGENHARPGRIVDVTSDSDSSKNGPWYLIASDYTRAENWIKLIGRGDLITTSGGGNPSDTNIYSAAKTDSLFPKKQTAENITASWTFKENQVFEKDLTTSSLHATTGTIETLETTTTNSQNLNVSETTTTKELKVGTSGSIKDENGETVARVDRIIAEHSELEDIDDKIREKMGLIGVGNFLKNTSFAGQYESLDLIEGSEVSDSTVVFNSKYDDWNVENAYIVEDSDSVTGHSIRLENDASLISQETVMALNKGASYIISWKQKGTIEVEVGEYELEVQTILETPHYKFCFSQIIPTRTQKELVVFSGGPGNVFEIKLEEGILPTSWFPSVLDTDPLADELYKFEYLRASFMDHPSGSDLTISNIFLRSQIKLGEIINNQIVDVYGGISGVVSDGNDVMIWSGGSYEKAVELLSHIENDESYLDNLTPAELKDLTKAIITLNYKSIFTDIYAVGKFKGKHLDESGGELCSYPRLTGFLPSSDGKIGFTKGRLNKVNGSYPTSIDFGGTIIEFNAGLCINPEGQFTISTGEAIEGITELHLIFHEGYLTKISSVKDYNTTYYWY